MQQHPQHGEQGMTPKVKTAFYFRVSTLDQSTGIQETDLRRYAGARGLEVFKEYRDHAVSGGKDRRPALDQLMDDARKRRFDVVVVWRFDRFARSTTHLHVALDEFKALGIGFSPHRSSLNPAPRFRAAPFLGGIVLRCARADAPVLAGCARQLPSG